MNGRKVLGFAIGPIGAGLLAFITIPVMTWVFSPKVVGMLSMLQVAINLSTVLFSLGLDQSYVREYHEAKDRSRLLRAAVLPGFMLLVCLVGSILLIWPKVISIWLFGAGDVAYGLIVAVCLVAAYFARFLSLILRMQERGLAYSMSQLLSRLLLLSLVAAIALFPIPKSFVSLLIAQCVALLATLAVFAWNTRNDWIPALVAHINLAEMVRLFHYGWPLAFGGVASWALMAMDRVFLRSMSTYGELAVYSVASSIAAGVTIFAGIFNTIWAPMVYKWIAEKGDLGRIKNVADHMMLVMFLIMCLTGASSWIVGKLLPTAYGDVPYILPGCMVAPLLYTFSEVTGIGISVMRRTTYSLAVSVVAVVVNIIMNFAFVPKLGALGAMLATALSFWCFFVLKTEISARIWSRNSCWREHGFSLMLIVLPVLFSFTGRKMGSVSIFIWAGLFVFGLAYGRNRLRELWWFVKVRQSADSMVG
jgi:O-antigen/teichoic acid export membrane protein